MTDAERPETAPDPGAVRRQGAAAAARRARRIGGLPLPPTRDEVAVAPEPPAPRRTAVTLDKSAATEDRDVPPAPARLVVAPDWLRWLPAAVVSAAAITMAVLLVGLSHGVWWAQPSAASVRDRVLAAAKTCMTAINTYKYTELDAYERKALGCTTGAFTSDLRQAIHSIVQVKAPQLKASQTISVHDVGIESVSGDHWTVLVFAQVDLKSTTYPKGSHTPYAAEVELAKVGGKWLLSRETTLGGAGADGGGASSSPSVSPSGSAPAGPSGAGRPSGN